MRVSRPSFTHFFQAPNVRRCWPATFASHVKDSSASHRPALRRLVKADPGTHPHGAHPAITSSVKVLGSSRSREQSLRARVPVQSCLLRRNGVYCTVLLFAVGRNFRYWRRAE
jgi:hypothetical protein